MTTIDVRWILLGGALCACLPAPPEPAHGVVDQESIWLTGLDSPTFQLSAKSHADLVTGPNNLPQKWHLYGNGTLRQGVAYQTGTGAFNHKSRLGVGRCALPTGDVWWVLVFGS